nr:MobF family relaxase [Nesterenkonia alkaliphila]
MTINYYLSHASLADGQEHSLTDYYTEAKAPPGEWFGTGLAGLSSVGVGEQVTEAAARAVYERQADPGTGEKLGRPLMKSQAAPQGAKTPMGAEAKKEREGVAGFDLTFSPPKSVSALWAMGGPDLQDRLHQAHRQAVAEVLTWAEQNVIQSRAGHGGVAHVEVEGMVASLFDHWDSRAGDPQLHTHAVIANRVQRSSDGQWVTLDSYTLHRHVVALSEMYNSVLYDRIYEQAGAVAESRTPGAVNDLTALVTDAETPAGGSYEPAHRTELAGVPDRLIEEFSQRSATIEARTDELIAAYKEQTGQSPSNAQKLKLRQQATLESRPDKDSIAHTTLPEKLASWRDRARAAGYQPEQVVKDAVGGQASVITPDMLNDQVFTALGSWALADASQRRTTFSEANVRASAERVLRLVRCSSFQQRQQIVDQVVHQALQQAVALTPGRSVAPQVADRTVGVGGRSVFDHRRTAGVYTTQDVLDQESYLIDRVEAEDAPNLGDVEDLQDQLARWRSDSGYPLSEDQYQAAHQVLSSQAGISAIIGPAGTGKTTTMSAITDAWQQKYGQGSVVGLAPSAVAAGVLGDEIGVTTENTAKWLHESVGEGAAARALRVEKTQQELASLEKKLAAASRASAPGLASKFEALQARLATDFADQARYRFRAGQLLILDEASMVSTAQLAELAQQAEAAGAKVLMVGDPAQLEAVDAGGFLGHIERNMDHAALSQVWRFRQFNEQDQDWEPNKWEAEASLRLRRGDTSVLAEYDDAGRLHGDPDTDAADAAYQAWKSDQDQGKGSILIASDNQAVADLNARAHADLVASGQVDITRTVQLRNTVEAGIGDVLLARKNNRNLRDSSGEFIANGTRLKITQIRDDGAAEATVESNGATVVLDADYLQANVEHGYACTAHRAQGVTVDTAHAVVAPGLNRELFYVAMTRGKEGNHAYVDFTDEHTHSPDAWEMLSEEPAGQSPAEILESVVARASAEKSAHEVQETELGWANDVGRLCHEAAYLQWASRLERTKTWAAKNLTASQREAVYSDQRWQRLVAADPAAHHVGQIRPEDGIEEILDRCQRPEASAGVGPGGMLPPVEPATGAQPQVWDKLQVDVADQVNARISTLHRDKPEWFTQLQNQFSDPAQRTHAIEAVVVWRHVSGQTDEATALGREPAKNDCLRPYWNRLQLALNPPPETAAEIDGHQPEAKRLQVQVPEEPFEPQHHKYRPLMEDSWPVPHQADTPDTPTMPDYPLQPAPPVKEPDWD